MNDSKKGRCKIQYTNIILAFFFTGIYNIKNSGEQNGNWDKEFHPCAVYQYDLINRKKERYSMAKSENGYQPKNAFPGGK